MVIGGVMISNNFNITNQKWYFFSIWYKIWNQTPTGTGNEEVMINFGHFNGYNAEFRYLFTRTGNLLDASL